MYNSFNNNLKYHQRHNSYFIAFAIFFVFIKEIKIRNLKLMAEWMEDIWIILLHRLNGPQLLKKAKLFIASLATNQSNFYFRIFIFTYLWFKFDLMKNIFPLIDNKRIFLLFVFLLLFFLGIRAFLFFIFFSSRIYFSYYIA